MKKAKKLAYNYFEIRKKGKLVEIYLPTIYYEDGSVITLQVIGFEEFKKALKENVSNLDDFNNFYTVSPQVRSDYKTTTYWSADGDDKLIENVTGIEASRVKNDEYDLATIEIELSDVNREKYVCEFDDLENFLNTKVENYEKLKKHNNVYLYDSEQAYENSAIVNSEVERVVFYIGKDASHDEAYFIYENDEDLHECTVSEAIEFHNQNPNVPVECELAETNESISIESALEFINKRNATKYSTTTDNFEKNTVNHEDTKDKENTNVWKFEPQLELPLKRNLARIVIYSFVGEHSEFMRQAILFYNDGTVENVDIDTALETFTKTANERGSLPPDFLVSTSGKEMSDNWAKYMKAAKNFRYNRDSADTKYQKPFDSSTYVTPGVTPKSSTTNEDKKPEHKQRSDNSTRSDSTDNSEEDNNSFTRDDENEEKNKPKSRKSKKRKKERFRDKLKRNWKAVALVVAAVVASIGAVFAATHIGKKIVDGINKGNTGIYNDDMENKNNDMNSQPIDVDYKDTQSILSALAKTNPERHQFLTGVGRALTKYNVTAAEEYLEEDKGTKMAHSFTELESQYLVYNDIEESDIHKIFGNQTLDEKIFRTSFENAIMQDGLAHNIQTKRLPKEDLFNTKEGKDFYVKYNNLFTNMNIQNDANIKARYMKQFYDMVRKDFTGIETQDYSSVKSYQISILEYISAMNNMNISVDNEFTADEYKYFEGLKQNVVYEKYKNIVTIQNARVVVDSKDTLPQIDDYQKLVITSLTESGNYDIEFEKTDVRNYDSYKAHINGEVKEKNKDVTNIVIKEPEVIIPDNNSNNNSNSGNTYSYGDNNNGGYTSEEDYSDATEIYEEQNEIYDFDFDFSDGSTEITYDASGDDGEETYETTTDDETTYEFNFDGDSDDTLALDEFILEENEVMSYDAVVTYDENVSSDGQLSEYYTNETTDGQDAVQSDTSLPDPNATLDALSHDELADMLVEKMANETYEEEPVKTYSIRL